MRPHWPNHEKGRPSESSGEPVGEKICEDPEKKRRRAFYAFNEHSAVARKGQKHHHECIYTKSSQTRFQVHLHPTVQCEYMTLLTSKCSAHVVLPPFYKQRHAASYFASLCLSTFIRGSCKIHDFRLERGWHHCAGLSRTRSTQHYYRSGEVAYS